MKIRELGSKRKMIIGILAGVLLITLISCIIAFVSYTNKLQEFAEETTLQKNNMSEMLNNALDLENSVVESASTEIGKTVEELQKQSDEETDTAADVNEGENTRTDETIEVIQDDVQDPVFLMPIKEGKIIKEYAKDSFVYSETLEEWITHLGVDIKADKATVVKASAAGTVTNIKNDPRYGLSVIIEHTNGYKTIYSNLLTAEFVEIGESVEQGQTVGTVGATATFEIADESHLHFEILKDDENVDPTIYLVD